MELLALSDIAKKTGIPAPTARRYAALFKDFLAGKRLGRMTRYPEQTVGIFQRIGELYAEGRITAEIEDILRREFPRTIEVGAAPEPLPLPAATADLPANLARALSDALADSMSGISEALGRLAQQKDSLDSHQADIDKLKNGFVLLARNLKRVAQREQAEADSQLQRLSDRLKAIEPKLAVMEEITLTLTSDNADLKARLSAQEVEIRRLREDRDRLESRPQRPSDPRS